MITELKAIVTHITTSVAGFNYSSWNDLATIKDYPALVISAPQKVRELKGQQGLYDETLEFELYVFDAEPRDPDNFDDTAFQTRVDATLNQALQVAGWRSRVVTDFVIQRLQLNDTPAMGAFMKFEFRKFVTNG
jgi:hypothetical protein